jgi:hypothetical protein
VPEEGEPMGERSGERTEHETVRIDAA